MYPRGSALYMQASMAGPSGFLHDSHDRQSAQYEYSRSQPAHPHGQQEDTADSSDFEIVAADYRNGQAVDADEIAAQDLRQKAYHHHPLFESHPLYRQTSESGSSENNHNGYLTGRQHEGYHITGNESEISLPLYRSRSHSILEASQSFLPNTATAAAMNRGWQNGQNETAEAQQQRNDSVGQQSGGPTIRAVDFQTGQRYDDASSRTPGQAPAVKAGPPPTTPAIQSHSTKGRHVDFAASVTKALNEVEDKVEQEKPSPRPGLERVNSDYDLDDEHNTTFDDYDWSDDDELVKQLDERYEKEYKEQIGAAAPGSRRRTVIRKFSPVQ